MNYLNRELIGMVNNLILNTLNKYIESLIKKCILILKIVFIIKFQSVQNITKLKTFNRIKEIIKFKKNCQKGDNSDGISYK